MTSIDGIIVAAMSVDAPAEEHGEHDWETSVPEWKEYAEQVEKVREQYETERNRREANLNAQQPTEEELMLCDSSFKKNNGLIRKLKSITLKDKESLCADVQRVNQTKYVSEVVTAIAESVIRGKDMPAAIEICSLLHQRYTDFAQGVKEALIKSYLSKTPGEEVKIMIARRRSCLRLLIELYLAGIFDGLHVLLRIAKDLTGVEYEKDPEMHLQNVILLTTLAKIGRTQMLHLPQQLSLSILKFQEPPTDTSEEVRNAWRSAQDAHEKLVKETHQRFRISENDALELRQLMTSALDRWFEAVLAEHKKLRDTENENTRVLNAKGELPENLAAEYEIKRKAFDHLYSTIVNYAESLDKTMPSLPEDKMARIAGGGVQVVDVSEDAQTHPLYDDAETREFYEVLPDLRSIVPPLLLGRIEEKDETTATTSEATDGDQTPKESEEMHAKQRSVTSHKKMDALLQKLRNCYTRDMTDEISIEFCYINSKSTKKRLNRALCDVPKGCLPLIPFYARITANLSQVFPDMAAGIAAHLEQEFNALLAKKDPGTYSLEPRISNVRYMGELCKFKLINYGTVFTCLKQLLDDFTHMNIDAACALIETAGSYFVRLPETQGRMESRLEQMNRLKNAKNLDSRHRALIDNAYFQCKPPKSGVRRKRRPPIREYIRHLIFTFLSESTIREVLKKLRKLSWEEHENFVVHCMLKANVKLYARVPLVASLCSGLAKYNDSLAVSVVDAVLEEIQLGMELPSLGLYQHRVAHVHFFGELYNYRLIDSKTIFETLYWMLSFGRATPEEMAKMDPPGDAFRIKMVCTVLKTCGRYFGKGTGKKKMDRFLVYFQRYILSKPPLSMDIEFEISDVFEHLRPDLERFTSFEDANAAVEAIEAELNSQEDAGKSGSEGDEEESQEEIAETDESIEGVGLDDDDVVEHGRKHAAPEIDLEFEQGLQALLQEHQRLTPDQIKPIDDANVKREMPTEKMPFKVLLKKGGKDDTSRRLEVPLSVTMAVRQRDHDNQEAADRSLIKERVLASHEQDEEDEFWHSSGHHRYSKGGRGHHGGQASFTYGGRRYRRR